MCSNSVRQPHITKVPVGLFVAANEVSYIICSNSARQPQISNTSVALFVVTSEASLVKLNRYHDSQNSNKLPLFWQV